MSGGVDSCTSCVGGGTTRILTGSYTLQELMTPPPLVRKNHHAKTWWPEVSKSCNTTARAFKPEFWTYAHAFRPHGNKLHGITTFRRCPFRQRIDTIR